MSESGAWTWEVLGRSVRGATHRRANTPNQDALEWTTARRHSTWRKDDDAVIVALADGHGSGRSFRSQQGARFAVQTALEVARTFWSTHSRDLLLANRDAESRFPRDLVRHWQEQVRQDLRVYPVTPHDLAAVEESSGVEARQSIEANPFVAYGSTLLLGIFGDAFAVWVQIGDGDILVVTDSGEVTEAIGKDRSLIANETTSLSTLDASKDVRVQFQRFVNSRPALVLMATDGYYNSFAEPAGFYSVAKDLYEIARSDGLASIDANLESWLLEASRIGSGDDISAAIIWRQRASAAQPSLLRRWASLPTSFVRRLRG